MEAEFPYKETNQSGLGSFSRPFHTSPSPMVNYTASLSFLVPISMEKRLYCYFCCKLLSITLLTKKLQIIDVFLHTNAMQAMLLRLRCGFSIRVQIQRLDSSSHKFQDSGYGSECGYGCQGNRRNLYHDMQMCFNQLKLLIYDINQILN